MTLPEPAPEYIVLRDFLRKEPNATTLQIFLAGWDGSESAGFQARSHLVELLIACRLAIEALKTTQKETGLGPIGEMIGEDLLARIDAALKGEK